MMLSIQNVTKIYGTGQAAVKALDNLSLDIEQGEYVAVMGESGSGKSTLLNILATLDAPTSGTVRVQGIRTDSMKDRQKAQFRREHLGFVFQDFNLVDSLSIRDNILFPLVLSRVPVTQMEKRLDPLAKELGLTPLLEKQPYACSGGQKQRAAAARALVTKPDLLLADEPTGALDSASSQDLLNLFQKVNAQGQTIVMVTHSTLAASHANRILFIRDGRLYHELHRGNRSNDQMYEAISECLSFVNRGHHD